MYIASVLWAFDIFDIIIWVGIKYGLESDNDKEQIGNVYINLTGFTFIKVSSETEIWR